MAAGEGTPAAAEKMKVKKDLLAKAIRALTQVIAKRSANANPLFESASETMTVLFTLSKIPDRRRMKPVMIPLPHPLFDDKSEICFISKDPQKTYKELLLQKHPVPGLKKVIGVTKLRKNYNTLEAKRALADAFDLFLCDSSVLEMMPKILGTIFYQKKLKAPLPVRLRGGGDPTEKIQQAINGTPLRVPQGPSIGVKVGRCSMSEEQLVANASAVIAGVAKHVGKWNPVQSISIQATDAPALPVWRRPATPGDAIDLKKHASETASSAASDTGASAASETGTSALQSMPSDAGETLSTRDTASELETGSEIGETGSELDSEAGDGEDAKATRKEDMPLLRGLKKKGKRKAAEAAPLAAKKAKAKAA
mmetsp:Transcript_69842/g.180101  ORF Transcript_69842/g.180101 Transcript_69842/m.180101 type:complete len:367 (+) Transcript_69842:79-1179(+)